MKKLLCVLVLCLSFCLSVTPTVAADTFAITVGTLDQTLDVKPGDEVVVPVYISGNVGVCAYAFQYSFDKNVLELQDDKMKQNGKGDYKCLINDFTINNKGDSVIILSFAGAGVDVVDNGVITYLFFKVKDNVQSGFSKISVTYEDKNVCNSDSKALYPAKIDGGVYIHGNQAPVSSQTPSVENTSSKPIGYVPQDTLPNTAPNYYSSTTALTSSAQQNSSSEQSVSSNEQVENFSSASSQKTSSGWQLGDIEVLGEGISGPVLIAIIIFGVAIIAGAIISYIISNKNKK